MCCNKKRYAAAAVGPADPMAPPQDASYRGGCGSRSRGHCHGSLFGLLAAKVAGSRERKRQRPSEGGEGQQVREVSPYRDVETISKAGRGEDEKEEKHGEDEYVDVKEEGEAGAGYGATPVVEDVPPSYGSAMKGS